MSDDTFIKSKLLRVRDSLGMWRLSWTATGLGTRTRAGTSGRSLARGTTVREIVEESSALGLGYLTLYAFSSENWKRRPTRTRISDGSVNAVPDRRTTDDYE